MNNNVTHAEIIEFARRHGITYCAPSPAFRVSWRARYKQSEEEHIAELARVPEFLALGQKIKRHNAGRRR
jgi:hypothetical protein